MSSTVPIEKPQPSQLYIDAAKLRDALEWFDFDDPTYEPLPVLTLDDKIVLSDGHTRAFLVYLSGDTTLEVSPEADRQELSIDLYRECVDWCREESIMSISDLAGRVVRHDTFLDKWIARCHASPFYEGD